MPLKRRMLGENAQQVPSQQQTGSRVMETLRPFGRRKRLADAAEHSSVRPRGRCTVGCHALVASGTACRHRVSQTQTLLLMLDKGDDNSYRLTKTYSISESSFLILSQRAARRTSSIRALWAVLEVGQPVEPTSPTGPPAQTGQVQSAKATLRIRPAVASHRWPHAGGAALVGSVAA